MMMTKKVRRTKVQNLAHVQLQDQKGGASQNPDRNHRKEEIESN